MISKDKEYQTKEGCEVEKPKTMEIDFWVNVYPDGDVSRINYDSKLEAETCAIGSRIDCINFKRTVVIREKEDGQS